MSILTNSKLSKSIRIPLIVVTLVLLFAAQPSPVRADEIAIWNFNDSNLSVDHGIGSLITSFPSFIFASGTTLNARQGDAALQALSLAGIANNGQSITFSVSTVGFGSISVSFATQRTSTGFNSNQFQYSLDGVTFIDFSAPYNPAASFSVVAFDLSGIAGLINNPNATFRIVFNGATSSTGNNRLDNLVVEGTPLEGDPVPEPATLALLATGVMSLFARKVRRKRKTD
ncbi:MAG TPA: PEP-CTERM sorting domain-containing protein [Pyrinomonadaceae bacterium]|nr:PEP-CTERM sorting domain-containing protein [Pyrinomonadaceae bacterium]